MSTVVPTTTAPQGIAEAATRRLWRHVAIYAAGVLTLSIVGGLVMAAGHPEGGLVFVISPVLMAVLLRTMGRDGWSTAGLRPRGRLRWYALALVAVPVTFVVELLLGASVGSVTAVANPLLPAILSASAANLAPWLLFATCEEFGWRGYLDPTLETLGVARLRRYLGTGLLWAVWHVPFILATPGYTPQSILVFAPLFLGSVLLMAIVFGELRRRTRSVWPPVIAHGVSNAVGYAVLSTTVLHVDHGAVFAPRPDSVLFIAIWLPFAWVLMRRPESTSS